MKKKILVPLSVFLLGICLVSLIVYKTDTHEKKERHITAQLNVATYGEQIKNEITNGIEITDTLKQSYIDQNMIKNVYEQGIKHTPSPAIILSPFQFILGYVCFIVSAM